mmetsp:Transcript_27842/g.30016  ORF Transcript_27842/g.30016 Transcript_27842/m.30016 type:complete len:87 (-) Transcript_27842:1100-1360(-)
MMFSEEKIRRKSSISLHHRATLEASLSLISLKLLSKQNERELQTSNYQCPKGSVLLQTKLSTQTPVFYTIPKLFRNYSETRGNSKI